MNDATRTLIDYVYSSGFGSGLAIGLGVALVVAIALFVLLRFRVASRPPPANASTLALEEDMPQPRGKTLPFGHKGSPVQ